MASRSLKVEDVAGWSYTATCDGEVGFVGVPPTPRLRDALGDALAEARHNVC